MIGFKKLDENAVVPTKAFDSDTGFDIVAINNGRIDEECGYIEYSTGLAFDIPAGYGLEIRPRSSVSKYDLVLINSPGTIDEDYTGELKIRFKIVPRLCITSDKNCQVKYIKPLINFVPVTYKMGDKIAQLVIEKKIHLNMVEVKNLPYKKRGAGGFGSTDIPTPPIPSSIPDSGIMTKGG